MKTAIRILVLTPSYPGEAVQKADTPVVHYFVREWAKHGYDVRVLNFPVNFPAAINIVAKLFRPLLETHYGSEIRTWDLDEREYEIEGVKVKRIPLVKYRPHTKYSKKQILSAYEKSVAYCEKERFVPDVITSHWVNPQFEIMHMLKTYFCCKTCYIAHDDGIDLKGIYKNEARIFLSETDIIGYRSEAIKRRFESFFNCGEKPFFMCYSGIPVKFLEETHREIDNTNSFIHVATLLKRKFPSVIVPAVYKAYGEESFSITYVGEGIESKKIKTLAKKMNIEESVHLLGRIPREDVVKQMDKHSVFVMISSDETFGLVYLEAMSRGCITIASRDEGFDGIIKDGENGFLCEAGNEEELTSILMHLKMLPKEELQRISEAAIATAHKLTDEKVALNYVESLISIL